MSEEVNDRMETFKQAHTLLVQRLDREVADLKAMLIDYRAESRERFDQFYEAHVRSHEKEHEAENRAAGLALQNLDRRLEGMNEFREQINSTEKKYSTKDELEAHTKSNDMRISLMEDRIRLLEQAAISDRGVSLDKKSADERFRAIERLIYMASGALFIIMIIVQFWQRKA